MRRCFSLQKLWRRAPTNQRKALLKWSVDDDDTVGRRRLREVTQLAERGRSFIDARLGNLETRLRRPSRTRGSRGKATEEAGVGSPPMRTGRPGQPALGGCAPF